MPDKPGSRVATGGGVFLVFGLVFTIVGATSNRDFLWIGIPFLVSGAVGVGYAIAGRKNQTD